MSPVLWLVAIAVTRSRLRSVVRLKLIAAITGAIRRDRQSRTATSGPVQIPMDPPWTVEKLNQKGGTRNAREGPLDVAVSAAATER